MILVNLTIFWLWYIEFLFQLYYWFQVKDHYKYMVILNIWYFFYIYAWIRYIFVRNYDFMYMIMNILTMNWFWYPNQWGLFIGILIPKPMGVIHWYSDTQPMEVIYWYSNTQTNGGYSLVLRYPNQWELFIGTLIPSHWDIAWP